MVERRKIKIKPIEKTSIEKNPIWETLHASPLTPEQKRLHIGWVIFSVVVAAFIIFAVYLFTQQPKVSPAPTPPDEGPQAKIELLQQETNKIFQNLAADTTFPYPWDIVKVAYFRENVNYPLTNKLREIAQKARRKYARLGHPRPENEMKIKYGFRKNKSGHYDLIVYFYYDDLKPKKRLMITNWRL